MGGVATQSGQAWTVRVKEYASPRLVYASSARQAAAITTAQPCDCCGKTPRIVSIRPNYHAQNMHPRPASWTDYLMQGGEPL